MSEEKLVELVSKWRGKAKYLKEFAKEQSPTEATRLTTSANIHILCARELEQITKIMEGD